MSLALFCLLHVNPGCRANGRCQEFSKCSGGLKCLLSMHSTSSSMVATVLGYRLFIFSEVKGPAVHQSSCSSISLLTLGMGTTHERQKNFGEMKILAPYHPPGIENNMYWPIRGGVAKVETRATKGSSHTKLVEVYRCHFFLFSGGLFTLNPN